jgi:hypothetical protein
MAPGVHLPVRCAGKPAPRRLPGGATIDYVIDGQTVELVRGQRRPGQGWLYGASSIRWRSWTEQRRCVHLRLRQSANVPD